MKSTKIGWSVLIAGLSVGGLAGCATERQIDSTLEAAAKIHRAEAQKIALAKVPGGTVKEAGIDEEEDKLIWTFDIADPATKLITEVQIDAKTGEIVAVQQETPKNQKK